MSRLNPTFADALDSTLTYFLRKIIKVSSSVCCGCSLYVFESFQRYSSEMGVKVVNFHLFSEMSLRFKCCEVLEFLIFSSLPMKMSVFFG